MVRMSVTPAGHLANLNRAAYSNLYTSISTYRLSTRLY